MATTAQIVLEVNDAEAVAALGRVGAAGPQVAQQLDKITTSTKQGREAAALLSEEFGVKMPRALRGVLAESSLIGPMLRAAFSTVAVVGFIDVALSAGDAIVRFTDRLTGHGEQAKKTKQAQEELNAIIAEGADKIEKLQEAYRLVGLDGLPRIAAQQGMTTEKFEAAKKSVADLTAQLQILRDQIAKYGPEVSFAFGNEKLPTGPVEAVNALKDAQGKIGDVTKRLAEAKVNLAALGEEARNAGKEFGSAFSKQRAEAIAEVGAAARESIDKMRTMQSEANKKGLTPEMLVNVNLTEQYETLLRYLELYRDMPGVVEQAQKTSEAIEAAAGRERDKIYQSEFDKANEVIMAEMDKEDELRRRRAEKIRRMDDETFSAERAAAIATAAPWDRANVSIVASYQERMNRIKAALATGDLDEAHAARQAAAAWNEAFGQMRDQLAGDLESLFNDITSGNIGKRFLDMFKHMVFQMIATWILGMNSMRNASAGAMGGGGGGILGAIFGGGGLFGGGGGPGGTPPFVGEAGGLGGFGGLFGGGGNTFDPFSAPGNANGAFGLFGLGLSAGQGAGTAGGVLPSGSATGGAVAGMGGVLSKLFPNGLSIGGAKLSGSQLAMAGIGLGLDGIMRRAHGGGVLGVLEGAAGGAMTGFAVGGPIGALIGGAIGLIGSIFAGLFGEHKGDKARKQVMEPLTQQIKLVKDSYDVFQTDYNSAVSELEALRTQSLATLKSIGGRQVSGNSSMVGRMIGDAETYLKATEAERARRSQVNFGPAQFHEGGFVHPALMAGSSPGFRARGLSFAMGGEVPAILHAGEFVMREPAVRHIGVGNLDRMNAGASAGGDRHIHVHAVSPKSFAEWLRSGGLAVIADEWDRAERHGGV